MEGVRPGFGIGLYPKAGNVVECTNTASDTVRGLVGDAQKPLACG